jgi:diacylglycerol kinase family enzyme
VDTALLVTNLAAKTVSEVVKQVIIKALSADLKLEVADTQGRNHATELARDAADRGFDLVISFGGDGTMNEVANGLIGTETALAVLPGGMANVFCRTIGVPNDIVEATGHLLNRLQAGKTRRVHVGRIQGRYFVYTCGVGLDAATVKRVEQKPGRKQRFGEWYFLASAIRTSLREYRGKKPARIRLDAPGVSDEVVLAVVNKFPHLTYFKKWPVRITPSAKEEAGFDVIALRRLPVVYVPRLIWSIFTTGSHVKYKQTIYLSDVASISLTAVTEPFPVQLDGEFVGDRTRLDIELVRDALNVLI